MRKTILLGAALAVVLTAGACEAEPEPGSGTSQVPDGSDAASADDSDSGSQSAAGTPENPVASGVAFAVGDWTVQFGATNPNAGEAIEAGVGYGEDPAAGRQYVMGEVTVTYTGASSGDPFIDLTFSYYGADSSEFGEAVDDLCGLLPNDLYEVGELSPDASATANVCVSVPSEQVDGGMWMVEDLWALDDSARTFVATS